MYKPHKGGSARIEYRAMDSACNPYLAFALMLAAGLKGVEEEYELPAEAEDDVWALTENERRAMGIAPLPRNLDEAIRSMEGSELVAETLGRARVRLLPPQQAGRVGGLPHAGHAFEIDRLMPVL